MTRHTDAFTELTTRMGYWVDLDNAYRTMDPSYVESVWWSLKEIFGKGLLVQDHRVAPWCPRCGTGLSDHELAQGYETVVDPSVFVRFPLTGGPLAGEAALLVWTTTPWTLVSNTAVAVHPDVRYVVATDGNEQLVVAEPLLEKALGEGWEATGQSFTGAEMERWTYQRPFSLLEFPAEAHYVVNAEYVTTDDGTGLVHQSPAFGEDDLKVCRSYGLPVVNPVRPDGTFEEDVPLVGGIFFKKADELLVADLQERGALFRHVPYEHSYPHCWRCHTALLYYAQPSWYIRTTAVKDAMLRENEKTNWFPDSVKQGRFGDWLNNNVDWALSRNRYWGTPLPIWRCEDNHLTVIGSRAELTDLTGTDQSELDPHRPYIDEVTFPCPQCAKTATRVPEVIDAWYDSGSMPFAQYGYPYRNKELFERRYPAQFISEAIDQTRGWFYTLMAVGTLVFDKSSYENVVCLGHILAEDGRKMSKHLGNILQPIPLMDQHGADAVRWFMAAAWLPVGGPPGRTRHDPGSGPQDAPHVLEHGGFPGAVRPYVQLGPVGRRSGARGPHGAGPLAAERAQRADGPGHPGPGRVRHAAGLQAALRLRGRPVQLVRTPLPPPLLAGRRGGAAHAARRDRDGDPADGPAHPLHHRAGLAGHGGSGDPGRP